MEIKKIYYPDGVYLNFTKTVANEFLVIKSLNKTKYLRVPKDLKWQLFSKFCLLENNTAFFELLTKTLNDFSLLITKKLKMKGLGLKAVLIQDMLELKLGFSHTIKIYIPKEIKISIFKSTITLTGVNLDALGNFAFKIKMSKKPNIYKGKGIWYRSEKLHLKTIKKS